MLEKYIKSVTKIETLNDAKEENFYHCLKALLNNYSLSEDRTNIQISISPKGTKGLIPDFRIWDGKQKIIGYIEVKLPRTNLDKILKTHQFKSFLSTFPNLILTNFYEFRLFRHSVMINRAKIALGKINLKVGTTRLIKDPFEFFDFLDQFLTFIQLRVYSSEFLALELSKKTRFLESSIYKLLCDDKKRKIQLSSFYKIFEEYLIRDLTEKQYADLLAQTITYGLFASRARAEDFFSRSNAVKNIPESLGIIHDIIQYISHGNLPPEIEWIVDDIAEILDNSDFKTILEEFFNQCKGQDETFYFFKSFLGINDPAQIKLATLLFENPNLIST